MSGDAKPKKSVLDGIELFGKNLNSIVGKNSENLITSPVSLAVLLALIKNGALGESQKELETVLNVSHSNAALNDAFQKILLPIRSTAGANHPLSRHLKMATKIYHNNEIGLDIKSEFENLSKDVYYSEIEGVSLKDADKSAKEINNWVSAQTNSKITNIISADEISEVKDMGLILVNAIYFKDVWISKFPKSNTKEQQFFLTKTKTKPVQMMFQKCHFNYAYLKDHKVAVLEMPYQSQDRYVREHNDEDEEDDDDDFMAEDDPLNIEEEDKEYSMIIYLPDKASSLEEVENSLKNVKVHEVRNQMDATQPILTSIPKFKIESTLHLDAPLKQLGLKTVYDYKSADFGNISAKAKEKQLFISRILQKAFIVVHEDGTEAAAATKISKPKGCAKPPAPPKPIEFKVDRPFLFQIVNMESNVILFSGKCSNPHFPK